MLSDFGHILVDIPASLHHWQARLYVWAFSNILMGEFSTTSAKQRKGNFTRPCHVATRSLGHFLKSNVVLSFPTAHNIIPKDMQLPSDRLLLRATFFANGLRGALETTGALHIRHGRLDRRRSVHTHLSIDEIFPLLCGSGQTPIYLPQSRLYSRSLLCSFSDIRPCPPVDEVRYMVQLSLHPATAPCIDRKDDHPKSLVRPSLEVHSYHPSSAMFTSQIDTV